MTTFLRLLENKYKQRALASAIRFGGENVFEVDASSFFQILVLPFAYWISNAVRELFKILPKVESKGQEAKIILGIATLEVMAALGHGVMDDSMVEAGAYVLEKQS